MHQLLNKTFKTAALLGALTMMGAVQAGPTPSLKRVSGGLGVLDTSTGLEWLQDWNLAGKTMTWSEADLWVKGLNASNYAGHNDWRLPNTNTTASSNCAVNVNPGGGFAQQYYGYNCTGSEMGHLFYNALGGEAGQSILDPAGDTVDEIANLALFKNVQYSGYWSGTEYAPNSDRAWIFYTSVGYQIHFGKVFRMHSLAVRRGG